MYKISEIISMPIISLYEGEYQGIINNILFDTKTKKCKFASIINEQDNVQKNLEFSDIFSIGQDCIFIKNKCSLELDCNNDRIMSNFTPLLNMQIYNVNGQNLGKSVDIQIGKNYLLENITTNNGNTIPSSQIVNIGKNIILISDSPISIAKFKPKLNIKPQKHNENKVIILSNDAITNNKTDNPITQSTPNKIITDFRFLIGRTITKDIVAVNGEIIAKINNIITTEIVNRASMYGKLVEITRYSNKKM